MDKSDLKAIETVLALGFKIGNGNGDVLYQEGDVYEIQDKYYSIKEYKSLQNAVKRLEA